MYFPLGRRHYNLFIKGSNFELALKHEFQLIWLSPSKIVLEMLYRGRYLMGSFEQNSSFAAPPILFKLEKSEFERLCEFPIYVPN